jgi:chemotaxis protein histidine kinase CheA
MLELDFIATKAHAFEEKLEEIKRKSKIGTQDLHVLIDEIDSIQELHGEVKEIINKISNIHEQFRPKRGYENKILIKSLTRLVNSLSDKHKKPVKLTMEEYKGDIIPYKHRLLIRDVLVQLIRNSMIHGIEDGKSRKQSGKNKIGNIEISNHGNGEFIEIRYKDDGQGLQIDKLRKKAISSGKWDAQEVESWTDEQISQVILESGISTAKQIGLAAGRGVGMGIIKSKVQDAGGKIIINNDPGKSLTFNIYLPKEAA